MVTGTNEGVKSQPLQLPRPLDPVAPIFCSVAQLSKAVGISRATLYEHAKEGRLQAGVHFINVGRSRLWNLALVLDRIVNWDDDELHQKAIDNFSKTLPSHWDINPGEKSA